MPCKFRTCYDVHFWPLSVAEAEWTTPDRLKPPLKSSEAVAAVRVELRCAGRCRLSQTRALFAALLSERRKHLIHSLYELLCEQLHSNRGARPHAEIESRSRSGFRRGSASGGFAEEEGMLPYPRRSFIGYRLLQEYFCFPAEIFLLRPARARSRLRRRVSVTTAEIVFLISPFERNDRARRWSSALTPKTFRLGCAPIINLFPQTAEPILLEPSRVRISGGARRQPAAARWKFFESTR